MNHDLPRPTRIRGGAAGKLVAAAVLMTAAGLAAAPTGAAGAEDTSRPAPLKVTKTAWYTNPAGATLPDILVEEFPPGVACILVPETCSEGAQTVTQPIDAARPDVDGTPHGPAQPVKPATLPTGRLAGTPRYASVLAFDLPPVPPGQEFGEFVLVLREDQPTYAMSSPAFRQAVLAVLDSYQQGEPAAEEFARAFDTDENPPLATEVMDVEVCPLTEPFAAGENQPFDALPERDCVFGANGVRADDGTWTFDLTLAAQAWADATLPNHGIYVGPFAAPNLAYGDPDPSDNAQVAFAGPGIEGKVPAAAVSFRPRSAGIVAPPGGFPAGQAAAGGFTAGPVGGGDLPGFGTETGGDPPMMDSGDLPAVSGPDGGGAAPAPAVASASGGVPPAPWYVWLLVPALLGGLYVLARALGAEPELATQRPGAMSRLVEGRSEGAGAGRRPRAGRART